MAKSDSAEVIEASGRSVRVSHPEKLYFSKDTRLTKLDIVQYFLAVAPGALRGIRDRPIVLKRFVNGAEQEPFYQKRAPGDRPAWMRTVTLAFPSGRTAEEVVVDDAAGLLWTVNLGCMELHPHPVRAGDLEHPDELRVDLDPGPGVTWSDVRRAALEVRAVLAEYGLAGWAKTSGSRGIHVNVPIEPKWSFTEVRRAALALSRAVERRAPALTTSKWWKEERHGVFLDYNQNAKDRTTAAAYSVRPLPDARVSAPLRWDEVPACEPSDFTVLTMPRRFQEVGDPHAEMGQVAGLLDGLLELAARDEAEGLADAPWPPHFRKMEGEAPRVQPSKRREKSFAAQIGEGFGPQRFRRRSQELAEGATAPVADEGEDVPGEVSASQKAPTKGRRVSRFPLVIVSQSPDREAAMAGLDRWREAHPELTSLLAEDDILVDRMRGRAYVWYRIRVNLRHVPEALRPVQAVPDPNEDPTRGTA